MYLCQVPGFKNDNHIIFNLNKSSETSNMLLLTSKSFCLITTHLNTKHTLIASDSVNDIPHTYSMLPSPTEVVRMVTS